MKLRYNYSYRYFYTAIVLVLGFFSVLFLLSRSDRTFADDSSDNGIVSDMHYVTIFVDKDSLTIKTDARTVADAVNRAGIELDSSDKTEPALDEEINSDNYNINIYRAHPVIVIDGAKKKFLMTASYDSKTIAMEAGVTVYDGDEIKTKEENASLLEAGASTVYEISRNGGVEITEQEDIPYEEISQKDSMLDAGQTKLIQVGELGRKVKKYKVTKKDGVEISRELISEEVIKQPVARITAVGMHANIPSDWESCANYARQAGVSENDLYVALTIIYKESGCHYNSTNKSSGAYGIPQALPGNKMASAGSDWETNPVTQIKWMIGYVNSRYGGWNQAWDYWQQHHWY